MFSKNLAFQWAQNAPRWRAYRFMQSRCHAELALHKKKAPCIYRSNFTLNNIHVHNVFSIILLTTNMKDTFMNSTSKRQQRVSELLFSDLWPFPMNIILDQDNWHNVQINVTNSNKMFRRQWSLDHYTVWQMGRVQHASISEFVYQRHRLCMMFTFVRLCGMSGSIQFKSILFRLKSRHD